MRSTLAFVTAVACALVLLGGVTFAAYELGTRAAPGSPAVLPVGDAPAGLSVLAELYQEINDNAVVVPGERELLEAAIEGLLEALDDPYAVYYDEGSFLDLQDSLDGRFSGGVGVMIEADPDGPVIVGVLPDTPADEAGIEVGERVVSVDGRDVRELPLSEVVALVTGEEGTTVRLGLDGGSEGPREVELTRAVFDVPTTRSELLDDGVGHIRLITFSRRAAEDVEADLELLSAQGAQGFVLDLRGNPGGLLREAIDVASVFIDGEVVVRVREADGEEIVHRAAGGVANDVPLVVLVDRGTGSASEVLAGALQDHGRAEIVGEPTFGKGTVQTIRRLSDGSGVKFTTAEFRTPEGRVIEEQGVSPDITVVADEDELEAARRVLLGLVAGAASPQGS